MSAAPRHPSLRSALRVQGNVIGALILRELHTRFGRENIGYLWLFAEPMLLAVAVALLHSNHELPIAGGIRPIPFAIAGYGLFIMFRSVVSRAETVLEANRPLLHHRPVTITDMLIARMALEAVSTIVMLALLLGAAWLLGYADPIARPEAFAGAVALMCWFSFGLSMIVTTASHQSPMVGRLVHPLLYLSMPLSGAFFALSWFPESVRDLLVWVPTVHIFELLKEGQFVPFESRWIDLPYVVGWCGVLTLVGLFGLAHLRARIELS
ncbi:ABC transporter permease [Sphingomonas sp. ST-64]|uniref:ABC transporter permease n=1 Tax=Sphingomonas plantiphila TaxID=3163295 RepID=A0ABW8YMH6_9SPHN